MIDKQVNSLRVSTIGMSQQSINALRMFFRGPCMNKYVLADVNNADISIIDMDTFESKQAWLDHRKKYPNRPTILESVSELSFGDAIFLRKPVNGKILKSTLNKVRMQLQSSPGSSLPSASAAFAKKSVLAEDSFLAKGSVSTNDEAIPSDNEMENAEESTSASLEFRKIVPADAAPTEEIELHKEQKISEKLVASQSSAAAHSISFVDKIRRIDNGNLAVNNITQLVTDEVTMRSRIPDINIQPNLIPSLKTVSRVKEKQQQTVKLKKISRIGQVNQKPVAKIDIVTPRIVFDKVNNKYITEETNSDLNKEQPVSIPVIVGGFHLNDSLHTISEDTLHTISEDTATNTATTPTPNTSSIKDTLKKTADFHIAPETNVSGFKENENENMFYNPAHYLQGYVKEAFKMAQKNKKNVLLQGVLQSITVLYQTREVFVKRNGESLFAMSERSLFAISSIPIAKENMTISVLTDSYDSICKEDGLLLDYDHFMWKLAIRASRGRVPEGTDLSRQIYLGQWPNIPKSNLTPNSLKIATLWAEEPRTLSMTAQMLSIPQRDVFIFLSAAKALDLIKYSNLYVDPEFRIGGMEKHIKIQALKKESVYSKMMKKIRSIPGFKSKMDAYTL
ncbi:MAG: hypothetical protein GXP19_00125 [Gammaproteobacteria bacterium]|nr:hypothetical protein [Gammaproteobacteria bacterium]